MRECLLASPQVLSMPVVHPLRRLLGFARPYRRDAILAPHYSVVNKIFACCRIADRRGGGCRGQSQGFFHGTHGCEPMHSCMRWCDDRGGLGLRVAVRVLYA